MRAFITGFIFAATIHLAALLLPAVTLAADDALVEIDLGAATFIVPEDWIDPGWRDAAQASAPDAISADTIRADAIRADTILLTPPPEAMPAASDGAFDPAGVVAISILLRDDPDLAWRALYVDQRIAAAAAAFGIASVDDAALAFENIPFEYLYGGVFASAGKAASRALHFGGSLPTSAHDTVAVAARIDGAAVDHPARLYSIAATIHAGDRNDAPLALVITLRTTRPLGPDDFALIGVAIAIANGRIAFTNE